MRKFPFLYISLLYVFSTKDKIIFYMQLFASLVIALCIAVIITSFSLMNGFNSQITENILKNNAPITIFSKTYTEKDSSYYVVEYNNGFEKTSISHKNISSVEYIRAQKTFVIIKNNNNLGFVREDPNQQTPIIINKTFAKLLQENNTNLFSIVDPNSYNSLIGGLSRQKTYSSYEINNDDSNLNIIKLSTNEYQKLFHNLNYNQINISLHNINDTLVTTAHIKEQLKNTSLQVLSWNEISPELFNALELQKKILFFVYIIIFTLLCSIIISTNVSFFKDKRKDWALIKILNVKKYAVERVFLYKNIISFLLSTTIGVLLGLLLTIYSNQILTLLNQFIGNDIPLEHMFGAQKLSYEFYFFDFIKIISFSFLVFFINFVILLSIFRKENIADFLKAP